MQRPGAPKPAGKGWLNFLNRADPQVREYHSLIMNAGLFIVAIVAMHKYGHKLAV